MKRVLTSKSVSPSILPQGTNLFPIHKFSLNSICIFRKHVEKISIPLTFEGNNGNITGTFVYIWQYLAEFFLEWFFRQKLYYYYYFIIIIIIIIVIIVSFMHGIHTHIPQTNHVPRGYTVTAILSLLFMVPLFLVPALALLFFYVSTSRSMIIINYYYLLTAIELSLCGSSPYTSTDKTNKNKYT